MSFRKMLGIITVVIISLFTLMLTTSYAWYSYENASTKFDVVTADDNVDIVYQRGEYINTESAIPLKKNEIDLYSDKYDFNIKVKKTVKGNEMVARISLMNITIDDELRKIDGELGDSPLRVELYYQGALVGNAITGKSFVNDTYGIGDVVLSDVIDNRFELRVYLLDNGKNQLELMDKKFQARINVNVVSRVNTNFKEFDKPDISISEIVIDGKVSKYLPNSGYYDMTSVCDKGSQVTWDSYNKTLQYEKGSFISDTCKLNFTQSNGQRLLKDVEVGSYVNYLGSNGCSGDSCLGRNANYVDDNNMGYCYDERYHFTANGFRVLYIKDNIVYLVSAGALDCVNNTDLDKKALKYCNSNFVYGGKCNSDSIWSLKNDDILQVSEKDYYDLIDNGGYYWYTMGNEIHSWNPSSRSLDGNSDSKYGIRVVIKIKDGVLVSSGDGTKEDPYTIK